jgi:hypothetical protein
MGDDGEENGDEESGEERDRSWDEGDICSHNGGIQT